MKYIDWLDHKLALPEDTEEQRAKKLAGWLAGSSGTLVLVVIIALYWLAGLHLIAALHIGLIVIMALALLYVILRPDRFREVVFITSLLVTIHPWLTNYFSGGFQSGLAPIAYALFGPLAALLLIGPRPAIFELGVLLVLAITSTFLDPRAAGQMTDISQNLRLAMGLFNMIAAALLTFTMTYFVYLDAERARLQSDNLLQNILPTAIATRLKHERGVIADRFPEVTILFADIVNFTPMSTQADPIAMVSLLNSIFSDFDDLADHYGLEKIKTIGDAYMVAGGLPQPRADHVEAVAAFAIDMIKAAKRYRSYDDGSICVRIGINTGPVVAGVIGRRKFSYDLWGDSVNVASRMESQGIENTIQVTQRVRDRLSGRYEFVEREPITVKGKGEMTTYLLIPPEV